MQAATLYWDSNGGTAGAGATPTGTWGTDQFLDYESGGHDGHDVDHFHLRRYSQFRRQCGDQQR